MAKHDKLDPRALAHRQIELDRGRVAHSPPLFRRKVARMSASPLAFLRGAAPLFFEVLREQPDLGEGPGGEGWLVGDAHVENFGAFRPRRPAPDEGDAPEDVAFDLNDFDEAVVGPFRLDVLRLTTSVLLGAREFRSDGRRALGLCDHLLENYEHALFHEGARPAPPRPVAELQAKVARRSRKELLAARTEAHAGRLRFTRGERYLELAPSTLAHVAEAVERYFANLDEAERPAPKGREIVDAAFRVAGTGSLGLLRVAVLLRLKEGGAPLVFDLKEQRTPAASALAPPPKGLGPAERVVSAALHCLEHPPRRMAVTALAETPMLGRQLSPQEDKLALARIADADLEPLVGFLGALLGRAHRRGATHKPAHRWSKDERDALLDRAIRLASLHEAVYLWYCRYAPAVADAL
ncbi:MAG TPA: DUF2252 family protein [Polyangiaceae bacterium]|nr:DUF2252 family protein [Polyangiaceae bacterium]